MAGHADATPRRLPPEASQWVRAAQAGDEESLAALFTASLPLVRLWAARDLGSTSDDVVQHILLSAYLHLPELQEPTRFGAWLRQITRNACRKWIGRRKMERLRFVEPELLAGLAVKTAGEPDATDEDGLERLRTAMSGLSVEDRTAVTLFHFLSLPQKTIACLLDVPEGTVKSRLHRARQQLKRSYPMTQEAHTPATEQSRHIISGMRGIIQWQSLLAGEGIAGWESGNPKAWQRQDAVLIGRAGPDDGSRLQTGGSDWRDYELSVMVTPLAGGNAQVFFRISADGKRWYLFDMLLGWQAAAISLADTRDGISVQKLSVVNYAFEIGREYHILIAARGASLTTYVDGRLVNQLCDRTLDCGPVALNVWESQTAFRDPRIRLLH
jgi:RNA polymerase sigma-70 factor (ECF subfamily)